MKSTILTMLAVLLFTSILTAQSTQLTGEVFSWNGELVALDGPMGEWVTATSPHGASAKSNPVTMVRPYIEHATAIHSN